VPLSIDQTPGLLPGAFVKRIEFSPSFNFALATGDLASDPAVLLKRTPRLFQFLPNLREMSLNAQLFGHFLAQARQDGKPAFEACTNLHLALLGDVSRETQTSLRESEPISSITHIFFDGIAPLSRSWRVFPNLTQAVMRVDRQIWKKSEALLELPSLKDLLILLPSNGSIYIPALEPNLVLRAEPMDNNAPRFSWNSFARPQPPLDIPRAA
jgi:hypothetical protein